MHSCTHTETHAMTTHKHTHTHTHTHTRTCTAALTIYTRNAVGRALGVRSAAELVLSHSLLSSSSAAVALCRQLLHALEPSAADESSVLAAKLGVAALGPGDEAYARHMVGNNL